MVFLLLILNIFHNFFSVFIVDFEQENVSKVEAKCGVDPLLGIAKLTALKLFLFFSEDFKGNQKLM